ncbi:MAG TPA: hypothetical protein VGJ06_01635 [Candidatus Acidoferrum sp.]
MELNPYFKIVVLVWFFGWGLSFLLAPVPVYRFLSWGRTPTGKQLKIEKWLGILALAFGLVFVIELVLGLVR